MPEIKLKPCPFCGSNDIDYGVKCGTMRGFDYVQCENCGAEINAVHNADGFIAAEELWNRRADNVTEAIREFAEKLKALANQKNYMLSDIHNSKDLGMFTLGFEQVIDEILEEMEKE